MLKEGLSPQFLVAGVVEPGVKFAPVLQPRRDSRLRNSVQIHGRGRLRGKPLRYTRRDGRIDFNAYVPAGTRHVVRVVEVDVAVNQKAVLAVAHDHLGDFVGIDTELRTFC